MHTYCTLGIICEKKFVSPSLKHCLQENINFAIQQSLSLSIFSYRNISEKIFSYISTDLCNSQTSSAGDSQLNVHSYIAMYVHTSMPSLQNVPYGKVYVFVCELGLGPIQAFIFRRFEGKQPQKVKLSFTASIDCTTLSCA